MTSPRQEFDVRIGPLPRMEGVTLYVRVREALRDHVRRGDLRAGEQLPSEDELAGRFGVSRMTLRKGIDDLIQEGILYRRQGVGTFVAQLHIDRDHTTLTSFMESARREGIEVRTRVLSCDVVPAQAKVARALSLDPDHRVYRLRTLQIAAGVPLSIHEAYVPHRLLPDLDEQDLDRRQPWEVAESRGVRVKRAVERLEARLADKELARLLEIGVGDPILYKERTVLVEDGTPLEFTFCYNRGDRYSLTVSLTR